MALNIPGVVSPVGLLPGEGGVAHPVGVLVVLCPDPMMLKCRVLRMALCRVWSDGCLLRLGVVCPWELWSLSCR